MLMRVATRLMLVVGALALAGPDAIAKDYFLVIGGGYSPDSNQASIESNVRFFQRTLGRLGSQGAVGEIYFADGPDAGRNVQLLDDQERQNCPPARRIMTELFGDADDVGLVYRNHTIADVAGPNDKALLRRRFRALGRELRSGDRVLIYVTGHGSEPSSDDYFYDEEAEEWVEKPKADDDDPASFDTLLHLWNDEDVSASQFARWLDRWPPGVAVTLVMVQCYSGGFSHAIFHQNNHQFGLSPAQRCGFFAQVHDRPAAGCTPGMREADYREYSTYFWAALGGAARDGTAVERPDYDGDGRVSLAEAHAYVVIESDTIDIPISTSDALLRHYSRLGQPATPATEEPASPLSGLLGLLGAPQPEVEQPTPELLAAVGPLENWLTHARPDQQAILTRLPPRLDLEEPLTVEAIRRAHAQAEHDLRAAIAGAAVTSTTAGEARDVVKQAVQFLWPELGRSFTPTAAELTGERSDEFVAAVDALPSYQAFQTAEQLRREAEVAAEAAGRREAQLKRLIHAVESIVLATNLPRCAPDKIVRRYHELIALERQSFD